MNKKLVASLICGSLAICSASVGVSFLGKADLVAEPIAAWYVEGSAEASVEYGTTATTTGASGIVATMTTSKDRLVLREVIDLNEKTSDDILVNILPAPKEIGFADFGQINVELVDVYDESNFITLQYSCYAGRVHESNSSYGLGYASNGQRPTGKDKYTDKVYVGEWGCYTNFCFSGSQFSSVATNALAITYDNQTKQFFVYDKVREMKFFIVDLDDRTYFGDNLWAGFTTGEVYCRIWLNNFESSTGTILVNSYSDYDLKTETVEDKVGPVINVDFGEYTEENYPAALVNYKYSLFNAKAYDLYSGEANVSKSVYYNYYSSSKVKMNVSKDGTFTPQFAGEYHVVYTAKDAQGNVSEIAYPLTVKALIDENKLALTFDEYESSKTIGSLFELPKTNVSGNCGNVQTTITATNEGFTLQVENGAVRPIKTGKLVLTYVLTDYIGQTVEETIKVDVTATDKATFIETPVLPNAFVNGNVYQLPVITAYNYVDQSGSPVDTVIKIKGKDGVKTLNGNVFVPEVAADKDTVTIVYEAMVNDSIAVWESEEIPVYITKADGVMDMAKYFVANGNGTAVATKNSVDFCALGDVSYMFVNALYSNYLSLELIARETTSNLGMLEIEMVDYSDSTNRLKFTYEQIGNSIYFYMNGDREGRMSVNLKFVSNGRFTVEFDCTTNTIAFDSTNGSATTVSKNVSGEPFKGFTDSRFYVIVSMKNIKDMATLGIEKLNGNFFSNSKRDYIGPTIGVNGDFGGERLLGETYTLAQVLVFDVLDGERESRLTVTDPEGNIVTAMDGKVLEDVLVDGKDVSIKLTKFGSYYVTYTSKDGYGNKSNFAYAIQVIDNQAPVIKIEKDLVKTAKVGEKITVYGATATDDKDGSIAFETYVILPDQMIYKFDFKYDEKGKRKAGGFVAKESGEYHVLYVARDAEGNTTVETYVIMVEEA